MQNPSKILRHPHRHLSSLSKKLNKPAEPESGEYRGINCRRASYHVYHRLEESLWTTTTTATTTIELDIHPRGGKEGVLCEAPTPRIRKLRVARTA